MVIYEGRNNTSGAINGVKISAGVKHLSEIEFRDFLFVVSNRNYWVANLFLIEHSLDWCGPDLEAGRPMGEFRREEGG